MERHIERQPVEIGPPFGFEEEDWKWFVESRLEGKPDDEDLRIIGELSRLPKELFLRNHNTFSQIHSPEKQTRIESNLEKWANSDEKESKKTEDDEMREYFKGRVKYYRLFLEFVRKRSGMAALHLNRLFERRKETQE